MRYSILFLASILLAGCASKPTEETVCTGNTLRGCKPVIYFDTGSVALSEKSKENLDWAYAKMVRFPRESVTVTGYTDSIGEAKRNLDLSKKRALAVKNYLVKKGIEADRIIVAFQGEFDPVCTKAACQNLNRRVELDLYKPNGGWEPIDLEGFTNKIAEIRCDDCE